MQMTKETITLAVNTGIELLGPNSDIAIPSKHVDGVFLLKQMLAGIAKGEIGLGGTMGDEPKAPNPEVAKAVAKALEDQPPADG